MKRFPELRQLSQDHHHGLVLARKARRAGTDSEASDVTAIWKAVAENFSLELEPHFRIEEKYLAPPLLALGETELIRRFNHEHQLLRELVKQQDQWSLKTLLQFGKVLEKHIRFEERELFEIAQWRLSPRDLKTIENACKGLQRPAQRR